jgi:hypothetical protein
MSRGFTRQFTSPVPKQYRWLVLVGNDASTEHELDMSIPCEETVRLMFKIPPDVPILIGRP